MKRISFEVNTAKLTELFEKATRLANELEETVHEIENYKLDCQIIKSSESIPLHDVTQVEKRLNLR